jgi:hypothetical protein
MAIRCASVQPTRCSAPIEHVTFKAEVRKSPNNETGFSGALRLKPRERFLGFFG